VPERWLAGRQLQIEYLKMVAPALEPPVEGLRQGAPAVAGEGAGPTTHPAQLGAAVPGRRE